MNTRESLERLELIFASPTSIALEATVGRAREFFGVRSLRQRLAAMDGNRVLDWKIRSYPSHLQLEPISAPHFAAYYREHGIVIPTIRISDPIFANDRLESFAYCDAPMESSLRSLKNFPGSAGRAWAFRNSPEASQLQVIVCDPETGKFDSELPSGKSPIEIDQRRTRICLEDTRLSVVSSVRRLAKDRFAGQFDAIVEDQHPRPQDVTEVVIYRPGVSEPWLRFAVDVPPND